MKIFVNKFEKMMNFKVNYLYFLNIKNMKFEIKGWFDVLFNCCLFYFVFLGKVVILYCKVVKGGGWKLVMFVSLFYLILRKNIV